VLKGTLRIGGQDQPATSENVLSALGSSEFFWLDLDDEDSDGSVSELLSVHFKFHPLAVLSAERFNQRPRIDDYETFTYLVARGADPEHTGQAEVHMFWTDRYVVTVHRGEECSSLAQVRARIEQHHAKDAASPQIVIVYLTVSALADSFFPVLSKLDDRIDALEDDILKAPTEEQLGELFEMKRSLMDMRKVIAP
jgi:magnesium transporter